MKFKYSFLALIILGLMMVCGKPQKDTANNIIEEIPIPVSVDTLRLSSFQDSYRSIGRVGSEQQVILLFEVAGKVVRLFVEEGDFVKEGQALAEIASDQYNAQFIQAKSTYEKAKKDLKSSEELLKSNTISSDQFDQAILGHDRAYAAYIQVKTAFENTTLRAPFNGRIIQRNLNKGDFVSPGLAVNPPFVLADMEQLNVIVPVPESVVGKIKVGQVVNLKFKTFPDKVFNGTVHKIGLATKTFSNNFDVKVRIQNSTHELKLGLIADVEIVTKQYKEAIVLPLRLIHDENGQKYIYVKSGNRSRRIDIHILSMSGTKVVVSGDLSSGDILITHGHSHVKDGSLISVAKLIP
ncbi:MAG: efflux RND transporter periplasmic adaptor subunit [Candidatus Marinimicrobia bacterium]|nr:efflux RND transporter periplasmic adaptor subunit [Candidatus Neomarinimicrobiota bacterium]